VVDTYTYTAYGQPVASTGTDANPFRYGGQFGYYTSTESGNGGLILCGARWYNPAIGRWLSRDPIGYDGGPNLYEYCFSRPSTLVDPSGAFPFDWKKLIGEGLFGAAGFAIGEMIDPAGGGKLGYALGVGLFDGLYAYFYEGKPGADAIVDGAVSAAVNFFGPKLLEALVQKFAASAIGKEIIAKATQCDGANGLIARALVKLGIRTCFVAGTPVWVQGADGAVTSKPIETIKEGDLVVSRDAKTGKTEAKRVTKTFVRTASTTLTLSLADAHGNIVETVTSTPEHPFYVQGKGFVPARGADCGSRLKSGRRDGGRVGGGAGVPEDAGARGEDVPGDSGAGGAG
jgi:RHS repeat-associated protein